MSAITSQGAAWRPEAFAESLVGRSPHTRAAYERDVADSDEITLARWRRRPLWEKVVGPFVWILERQQ